MRQHKLPLVKSYSEYLSPNEIYLTPEGMHGLFVLYKFRTNPEGYNVEYVGLTHPGQAKDIRTRLETYKISHASLWSHCSVFELWDNIRKEDKIEIKELFDYIYRNMPLKKTHILQEVFEDFVDIVFERKKQQ